MHRQGCVSISGILAALFTLVIIGGIGIAQGGVLFNPGPLNSETSNQPLGGVVSHADTGGNCSACHAPFWSSEKMDNRCLACHTNVQDGSDFHQIMVNQGTVLTCRRCHTDHIGPEANLTILQVEDFPHDEVGYSLHAHQRRSNGVFFVCTDCHTQELAVFEAGTCETCHRQINAAYMDTHTTAFGSSCLECHDGLDTYGADFDHTLTDYPLEGKHLDSSCYDCHPTARTLMDLQNTPRECIACHLEQDAHTGELGTDCAACHIPAAWEEVDYDHNESRFPLTGVHVDTACGDCHVDGRFTGTPSDCYSCHTSDDAHSGSLGSDCSACHSAADWEQVDFDHALTRFPLVGGHADVECEACHQDTAFAGTPTDCFSCHSGDDIHTGRFGTDCTACHSTENWEAADFDHALTDFALTGAHQNVECKGCHEVGYPGTPTQCASCHAEPGVHLGLFSADCAACHSTGAWKPAQFNLAHRFPINHGESGWSACSVCHSGTLSAYTCYGCHEHTQANIASEHREEGISNFDNCVRCHPTGQEEEGEHEGDDD